MHAFGVSEVRLLMPVAGQNGGHAIELVHYFQYLRVTMKWRGGGRSGGVGVGGGGV